MRRFIPLAASLALLASAILGSVGSDFTYWP